MKKGAFHSMYYVFGFGELLLSWQRICSSMLPLLLYISTNFTSARTLSIMLSTFILHHYLYSKSFESVCFFKMFSAIYLLIPLIGISIGLWIIYATLLCYSCNSHTYQLSNKIKIPVLSFLFPLNVFLDANLHRFLTK